VEFLKGKDFKTVVLKEYPGLGHQYPREENAAIFEWFAELYAEKLKAKGFVKWLEEGEKALKEGRFAEALKALRKITDLGLHDPITDKAEALLAKADGVGAGMLLEAEEKGSAGDYRGALALLREIVSGFPGLPCAKLAAEKESALLLDPAVKTRIAAEEEAERKEALEKEAGEALEKALRLVEEKAYGKALKALDVLAGKFGETEAGAEAVRRAEALRADPAVMGAVEGKKNRAQCKRWYQLGENYRKNGAKDLALTYYEKIVKLMPDSDLGRKAQRRINELKR
jgi:tetratricopeptide (TPR) repeat protein